VRRNARAVLGAAIALGAVLAAGGSALADGHGDPAYPSQQQVDQARADVAAKKTDLAGVRQQYAAAQSAAARAEQRAEIAAEAYNGAMWKLSLTRTAAAKAQTEAAAARQRVDDQRAGIAHLVVQSYQEGTSLNSLTAFLGADGPEAVMNRTGVVDMAGNSLRADYDRYLALSRAADDAEQRAAAAARAQQAEAARAKSARAAAATAARQAEQLRASVATRRTAVIAALATAEHVSVALAAQRQSALEEIARKKAEAEARRKAEAAAKKAQEQAAKEAAQKAAQKAADAAKGNSDGNGGTGGAGDSAGPGPGTTAPPKPTGSAAAAIAFAKAQLGEPYRWGAAGPDRWDCSGLTMMAWRAGGISLPHFSGAQYGAGTPIPVSQAQPGDLLFWSYNGRPSGIHHVALSVGGGQFIEAPHTGAVVRYNSIYDYYPNFAVRL
jgi:cell wall-associated NlpC family hydrolase